MELNLPCFSSKFPPLQLYKLRAVEIQNNEVSCFYFKKIIIKMLRLIGIYFVVDPDAEIKRTH
jgi:hypothetical protein